jgi:hypothetical protein
MTLRTAGLAFALIAAAATVQAQPRPFKGVANTFSNAGHEAKDTMSNAGHGAKDAMSNAGHGAKDSMSNAGHHVYHAGRRAVGKDYHRSHQPD